MGSKPGRLTLGLPFITDDGPQDKGDDQSDNAVFCRNHRYFTSFKTLFFIILFIISKTITVTILYPIKKTKKEDAVELFLGPKKTVVTNKPNNKWVATYKASKIKKLNSFSLRKLYQNIDRV